LPDDSAAAITGERSSAGAAAAEQPTPASRRADEEIPPEYRSGIAEQVKVLTAFVDVSA
jgi:hypothetical protein